MKWICRCSNILKEILKYIGRKDYINSFMVLNKDCQDFGGEFPSGSKVPMKQHEELVERKG